MATKIQLRRGTAARWESTNPILADGQQGWDKTNKKFKIGDGVTPWNDLEYSGGGGGHVIINEAGDSMTQRSKLQFIGATVTDDAGSDTTEVEIHPHSNKPILDQITAAFTTALKSAYDGAVTWISTNGTNILNHLSNTSNPHSVTKSQVGLGNVDNTADADKPISSATQTALDGKANQSAEEVYDPSTGSNVIADVHLAANASNAGTADYASSAGSATNDSDGNQISTTYQKLPNQYVEKTVADTDNISIADVGWTSYRTSFTNIWTWIKSKLGIDTLAGSTTKFLNQVGNWVDIVVSSGGGAVDIFASNVDSDISGYKSASLVADAATSTKTINSGAANTVVWGEKYLYGSAIGVTTIPSGFWELHLFGQVSTAVDVSQAVLRVFKYSGGTETQLFTADSVEINNTASAEIIIKTNQPQYTVLATDRIGVQVGFKSSSANPSKTFTYTIGNGSASHFNTPLAARHSGLRLLNEQVEYQHINLSNTPITGQFPASLTIPEGVPQIYSTAQLTNTVTVALGAVVAGKIGIYTLKFETGATKPTITWPTNVVWLNERLPVLKEFKRYSVTFEKISDTQVFGRFEAQEEKPVSENGGIIYHTTKWFTPASGQTLTVSADGLSVTLANPVTNFQFTSAMQAAKIIVSGYERIINAYTSASVVTLTTPLPSTLFNAIIPYTDWGVYSRGFWYGVRYGESTYHIQDTVGRSLQVIDVLVIGNNVGRFESGNLSLGALFYAGTSGLSITSASAVLWSSTTSSSGTKDIGLRRASAGLLEIYDGITAGTLKDIKLGVLNYNSQVQNSSDERLKKDIRPISDGLDKVLNIAKCVRHYEYINPEMYGAGQRTGYIAQLLQQNGFAGHVMEREPSNEAEGVQFGWTYKDVIELDENGEPKLDENGNEITHREVDTRGEMLLQIEPNFVPYLFSAIAEMNEKFESRLAAIEAKLGL